MRTLYTTWGYYTWEHAWVCTWDSQYYCIRYPRHLYMDWTSTAMSLQHAPTTEAFCSSECEAYWLGGTATSSDPSARPPQVAQWARHCASYSKRSLLRGARHPFDCCECSVLLRMRSSAIARLPNLAGGALQSTQMFQDSPFPAGGALQTINGDGHG